MKQYLKEELGVPELPNSPKPIFRITVENKLFSTDTMQWIKYADARISTSHEYFGDKAKQTLNLMGSFIGDAIDLYITMTERTWE